MITTLSAMRSFRWKSAIIGFTLLALAGLISGCTAVRMTYDQAPRLAWWWLDSYIGFADGQAPAVRQAIDHYFVWHRRSELPGYAETLARLQPRLLLPTTADAVCGVVDELRAQADAALQRAAADFAPFVPGLGEEQFTRLERKYAKNLEEMREDYAQADPASRRAEAADRARKNAERLYDRLNESQLRAIDTAVAESPFDAERWLAERRRRHVDVMQTLRRLAADGAGVEAHAAALRQLLARSSDSPDPTYRAHQQAVVAHNCRLAAQIHNAATPAPRRHATDRVRGWESDLRALAAAGS